MFKNMIFEFETEIKIKSTCCKFEDTLKIAQTVSKPK